MTKRNPKSYSSMKKSLAKDIADKVDKLIDDEIKALDTNIETMAKLKSDYSSIVKEIRKIYNPSQGKKSASQTKKTTKKVADKKQK